MPPCAGRHGASLGFAAVAVESLGSARSPARQSERIEAADAGLEGWSRAVTDGTGRPLAAGFDKQMNWHR